MKVMTLNAHAWLEEDNSKQLRDLAAWLSQNNYDLIALQEVNQQIKAELLPESQFACLNYQSIQHTGVWDEIALPPVKVDNFALNLVQALAKQGLSYYWTWLPAHHSYDYMDEGVAILSKYPFLAEGYLLSPGKAFADYRRRVALSASLVVNGHKLQAVSTHLSWWNQGFQEEWQELRQHLSPLQTSILLMGDFNNEASIRKQGYDHIIQADFSDSYHTSVHQEGKVTVKAAIAGWEGHDAGKRIDYIFTSPDLKAETYRIILNGERGPIVSDHFGIDLTLNLD
ncbi:hypothetical protein CL176_04795 [Suicoccus acidiformans]|uniref:Endonuclease/exonuclease/phosphatase domain-containing protein n=1 Tax=Suicoccus acidiformans TaxID=2036206 RepID=A0A347WJW5_9LACT|nr:endonuclease/exonuclease/phosphatase family protein [Suicoccus acidiformans]AXY25372.1 hypothetical protein CL176_04795 [Suicoccus acidiformans]